MVDDQYPRSAVADVRRVPLCDLPASPDASLRRIMPDASSQGPVAERVPVAAFNASL